MLMQLRIQLIISRMVANVESIELDVLRCCQWAAGTEAPATGSSSCQSTSGSPVDRQEIFPPGRFRSDRMRRVTPDNPS